MNEKFIENLYQTLVNDGRGIYEDLFNNTVVNSKTSDYWKNALELYSGLNEESRKVFLDVIQHTIIDSISSVFGVLDGSSSLDGEEEFDIKVYINGVDTEEELQDSFLEYVENNPD